MDCTSIETLRGILASFKLLYMLNLDYAYISAIIAIIGGLHAIWPIIAKKGAGFSPSAVRAARWAFQVVGVRGKRVVDLGCGYGRVLALAKSMGAASVAGVEIDPIRWLICMARCLRRCRVVHGDMFKFDVSDADVVYIFQWPSVNARLAEKLKRELKPGAYVVSYMWEVPDLALVAHNLDLRVYIYRIS